MWSFLAHTAPAERCPAELEQLAEALDRNTRAALEHCQTATAQQLELPAEHQLGYPAEARLGLDRVARFPEEETAEQQLPAAADSAKRSVARPLDRSAGLANSRSPQSSSRTSPRLRPMKRALEDWDTLALAVRAHRAGVSPRRIKRASGGEFFRGGLKNDCAPGRRARCAQSTSLLKPTA